MVIIWTLYAHIVTTSAGIFAIRAGQIFYHQSQQMQRRSLQLVTRKAEILFSTACHSATKFVEKFENFTLINEQKKVDFQHC